MRKFTLTLIVIVSSIFLFSCARGMTPYEAAHRRTGCNMNVR